MFYRLLRVVGSKNINVTTVVVNVATHYTTASTKILRTWRLASELCSSSCTLEFSQMALQTDQQSDSRSFLLLFHCMKSHIVGGVRWRKLKRQVKNSIKWTCFNLYVFVYLKVEIWCFIAQVMSFNASFRLTRHTFVLSSENLDRWLNSTKNLFCTWTNYPQKDFDGMKLAFAACSKNYFLLNAICYLWFRA